MDLAADWLQPIGAAWVGATLAACIGLVLVRDALPPAAAARNPRHMHAATGLLGLGLVAWVTAASQAMTDASPSGLPAAIWLVLTETTFGRTAALGLASWVLLALSASAQPVAAAARDGPRAALRWAALIGLAYALAATGHVADRGLISGAALVNTLHVLGGAAWAGVVVIGASHLRDWSAWSSRERSRLAHRLSRAATIAVPIALATGIANGVRMLAGAEDLASSPYVRLLLAKVLLVGVAVLLGLRNRWRWLQRLDRGEDAGAASFATILIVETLVLVGVLALAAKLAVTMPPE